MRTLEAVRPQTRKRVARETLEIYAPIANRLGLDGLYRELQELAFSNLYPGRYKVLAKAVKGGARQPPRSRQQGPRGAEGAAAVVADRRPGDAAARSRSTRSTTRCRRSTCRSRRCSTSTASGSSSRTCPRAISRSARCTACTSPCPGKFKDYIAIPKVNGYQSLHTTLIGPYGMPVEVQIRTQAMNRIAEAGVASHWLYKSDAEINEVQQRTHKWLQSLLDIQHASGDPAEFLEHIKVDLFPDEVYVFTPKGKIMAMPRGATAVDFAYAVHTDIGNRCAAARINYELAPLRTELKNGDRVEIITAAHANPNPAWLYLREDRQGALADPAFPEDHAVRGSRGAGRAHAQPGGARARREVLGGDTGKVGKAGARPRARNRARKSSPTSASASGSRRSSREAARAGRGRPARRPGLRPGRSSYTGPRDWRSSSPGAATPSRATRSSASSRRDRAWSSTRTTARPPPSRAATRRSGSTSSGRPRPTRCSTSGSA